MLPGCFDRAQQVRARFSRAAAAEWKLASESRVRLIGLKSATSRTQAVLNGPPHQGPWLTVGECLLRVSP